MIRSLSPLRTFEALRYREFRLIWLGNLGASMTFWMDQVTRGWMMYDLTGSAVQLGLVTAVQVLPILFLSPIAGSASDRYGRKTQLIVSQTLNIPPAVIMGLLALTGRAEPWHLYATGVAAAIVQVFQNPARQALVPGSVDPSKLTNAIGLSSVAFNMCRSLGPAMAGGLIAIVGAGGSYLVQAVIYAITTVLTMMLRLPNHPPAAREATGRESSFLASIFEGWRYIAGHPSIRSVLLVSAMAQLLGMSFTTLLPVFARDVLDVGAAGQGFLLTAQGMGALVSAFMIASLGDTIPKGKLVILGISTYGVLELAFAQSHWYPLSVVLMGLLGICHVSANALVQTIVQGKSAPEMRGRVMAVWQQNQVVNVTGGLLAGAAASMWGAPSTVAVMGAACTIVTLSIFLAIPHIREIR